MVFLSKNKALCLTADSFPIAGSCWTWPPWAVRSLAWWRQSKLADRQPAAPLPGEWVASRLTGLPQVALVQWTESVGLTLVNRDLTSMQLRTPSGQILTYCILQTFPFTSESKRMGVIVRVRGGHHQGICHVPTAPPSALPWCHTGHLRLTPGLYASHSVFKNKIQTNNLCGETGVAVMVVI